MDADVTGLFSPLSPHVAHARAAAARGAAAESAWRVKDCFELVTRFLAVACVAELLQSSRPAEEDAALLFQSLANPRGLSLGQWLSVLRDSVRKNRSHGGALDGVRGALLRRGSGGLRLSTIDEFVRWRNATIGHGLLPLNATEVLVDAQRWLEQLDVLLRELRDAAPDVQLCTAADDGSLVEWHHLHLASHSPDSHDLSAAVGVLLAHPAGAVPLSPWLQAAACRPCGALVLWFFDRIGDEDRPSLFQDAHGGHRRRLPAPALEALRRAAGKLEFSYEVVDDEENLRLVLRTLLKRHGYEVETAASVTPAQPTSASSSMSPEHAAAPSPPVAG